jgi:uncharacterized protein YndB with AHSA1/START domain
MGEVRLADDGPMIVATVTLPACLPQRAISAFTEPELVSRWWNGELTAELAPGGRYVVSFPAAGARLTGRVLQYEPGGLLEFSWSWDDLPPDSAVLVTATSGPTADSAVLTIQHGPHAAGDAGQTSHQEHWDGWQFFLPRLMAALDAGAELLASAARLRPASGAAGAGALDASSESAAARRRAP